jgi:N-acyl-D-aspartate/D-glutamate deacylase
MIDMLDYLIINATIVDGTGSEPYIGSVGVEGYNIVLVEAGLSAQRARQVIDAKGLFLTPGFIDTHASTGFGFFFPHAADHKLYQGITTEIFGNCGTSPAPIGGLLEPKMAEIAESLDFTFDWRSLTEYFDRLEKVGLQFNVANLTGHSTLRAGNVNDWNNIQPEELERMKEAMASSMADGAIGLSTGLIYAPGCFAQTKEIVELAKIAAEQGGIYASHMRDERDKLEDAIEETLDIGEQAGINVLVSHLKSAEKRNFGKIPGVIERLEEFNKTHDTQAKIDVYPYTAASTKLRAFIPKEILAGGIEDVPQRLKSVGVEEEIEKHIASKSYDLSQMLFISNDHPQWEGKSIAAIANLENWTLARTMIEILTRDTEVWIVYFCIDQADMDAAICWPNAMICTDSWSHPINAPHKIGIPHPRSYGAFTQFIYDYVKIKKLLSFQEAVRKMTSMPAAYFNITDRGKIGLGKCADLVLLDLESLKPNATYTDPLQLSDGVVHLWVNGVMIIEKGVINKKKPGVIIKNRHSA